MPNLADASTDSLSFLFKGEPSCGKSPAAASFPNCYIFDFEDRIQSVKQFWLPRGKTDIDYDVYHPTDFSKFDKKLDSLIASCSYETIIFDTLTSLSDLVLKYVLEAKGQERQKNSKAAAGKFIGEIEVNTIEDYGAESSALTSMIVAMRGIKCRHKILIAHVVRTEAKDLNGRSTVTRSLMTAGKKIAAKLPGYFDEIYHFSARPSFGGSTPQFLVHTAGTGDDFARSTVGLDYEIDFTNRSFYELVQPKIDAAIGGAKDVIVSNVSQWK
jgi:hypothetical protein